MWGGCVAVGVRYVGLVAFGIVGLMLTKWEVGLRVGLVVLQWVWGVLAGSGGCVGLLS